MLYPEHRIGLFNYRELNRLVFVFAFLFIFGLHPQLFTCLVHICCSLCGRLVMWFESGREGRDKDRVPSAAGCRLRRVDWWFILCSLWLVVEVNFHYGRPNVLKIL